MLYAALTIAALIVALVGYTVYAVCRLRLEIQALVYWDDASANAEISAINPQRQSQAKTDKATSIGSEGKHER